MSHLDQRASAERAIRNLSGVRRVINKLEVALIEDSTDVRESIVEALDRRAERLSTRIAVKVQDGQVALTGTVDSQAEKTVVLGAAKGTRGVRSVEDHIRIS